MTSPDRRRFLSSLGQAACETLTGTDLKAFNTFEQPRRVAPQRLEAPAAAPRMAFKLPPRSYSVAQLGY